MKCSPYLTHALLNRANSKVRWELVPGTLEAHPIHGYDAIETGFHRIHHPNAEGSEPTGEAKFINLRQNSDGAWKITRAISSDHRALAKMTRRT